MLDSKIPPVASPKRPFSALSRGNSRRSHPSHSMSLPKNKRVKIEQTSDRSEEKHSSSEGLISPNIPQGESQESTSDQSAAKWFASKNENVADLQGKDSAREHESPFYLAQQTSIPRSKNLRSQNAESFGPRARDDTENDELRGVIDDLTIENKKLKTVLRTFHNRSTPASSNPDRVFEVRMHGLPAEKKRELEEILRSFATRLGDSPSQPSSSAQVTKSASSAGCVPATATKLQPDRIHTDSGYASKPDSSMNSMSQGATGLKLGESGHLSKTKKDTDIEKFLLDIPDSLLPRHSVSVSDNAKMQLVVQRLEHLFTGKRAAPGEHSLPLQQQQISRSAAKADRREDRRLNRTAKSEGTREAHILPSDSKLNPDTMEVSGQRPSNQSTSDLSSTEATTTQNVESPGSPDQRPTRPLDLDINRAQVASDNIEYIRHLGLSSPQFDDSIQTKGQSWVYLNLLVSMAQLHTLNVTPAFVRKAVKQLSTKFELSKDGHKVRWVGGDTDADPGYLHQGSPESAPQRTSEDTGDDGGHRSGRSVASTLNNASVSNSDDKNAQPRSSNTSNLLNFRTASSYPTDTQPSTIQSKSNSTFDYKPVVFQGKRTFLKAKESYLDSSSSYDGLSPESGGLVHAFSQSSLKSKDDSYEGYVTFFNNPYFFTDLSGDNVPTTARTHVHGGVRDVLGMAKEQRPPVDDALRDANACYFLTPLSSHMRSWSRDCPQIEMSLSPIRSAGEDETQPIELDASGIGGVRPEDNFALDVQICRKRGKLENGRSKARITMPTLHYSYEVALCRKLSLQPSRLPPPSYVFFTTGSSSEADAGYNYDDADSEESSVAENSPAPAGFLWQWSSSSNERQAGDDDVSEASSSLGVLQAARARLPGSINETAGPVSGSLAATVGASWSAASNAPEHDVGRDLDDESIDSMSVEEDM
ncbi:hypothetical protein H2200_011921 [Cladophialophora chaetospira]|uniref:Frequency clock protein n=1 Tax=Cladophialophora chaetospira TaxID=386627 RepID=A0AA38WYZ8_9EURO|nr:hypothetical protein H2200_011921 [Cladophialophora chaetospira]